MLRRPTIRPRLRATTPFAISGLLQAKHCRSCVSTIGRWENWRKMRRAKRRMQFSSCMGQPAVVPNLFAASLPTQISGRNRAWRRMIIDAIRNDPGWHEGDYTSQPPSLRTAAQMLWFMSSNPVLRQKEAPTLTGTDEALNKFVDDYMKTGDANDVLYAMEASYDYDPGPNLEKIRVPLVAINCSDDLINPPELGIPERER